MNNSRLNGAHTVQESSRNMNTSDQTISKSDDYELTTGCQTQTKRLDNDVCKKKDNFGCQQQSKCLHHSENDSELFAHQIRIKTVQMLTLTEPELLKKRNDNGRYDSQDYNDTDDSQNGDGTDDSQDVNGTDDSQDDDVTVDSRDDGDANHSQEDGGKHYSQSGNGTDRRQDDDGTGDSQDDGDTNDNQEDDGSDDGHKGSCNKKDEAYFFYCTHETHVSEGGEADLHKHLVGCKKNPGHTKFVPVNDFNINHLPEGYQDNDLVEYIKAVSDLTLRVDVKMTSKKRPEFWPNTTVPYAFYNMRGSDVMRVGTGMVWNVNNQYKCQHSDTPRKVKGEVWMYTATHVVFDDLEARHMTCRLFYDRQDSPLVTLDGWMVMDANIEEDWCQLRCVTCDVDLLDKLENMWTHWCDLYMNVNNKYKSSRDKDKLTFIVSHPHGCPKQVSLGHWINRYEVSYRKTKYTYTTCTCPGSSGAHVHPLGYDDGWCYDLHVHSGVNSVGNNYSGTGQEYPLYL